MDLIHPKCKGNNCGSWEMCFNANVLKYGCVYYDDEAENIEIETEIKNELDSCEGVIYEL